MSIARMVGLGVERYVEQTVPQAKVVTGGSTAKTTTDSAMEKIAAFIPSEVIGIYVAGLAILSPESTREKWWILGICVALVALFMAMSYWEARKRLPAAGPTAPLLRINLILFIFAEVAFVAWTAALPGTPFLSFGAEAQRIGGFAVVALAALMYKAANLMGVVPK